MRFRIQRQRWTTIDYKLYIMSRADGMFEIIPMPKLSLAEQDILAEAGLLEWRNSNKSEATMILPRKEIHAALAAIAEVLNNAGYELQTVLHNNRVWVTEDKVEVYRTNTLKRLWTASVRNQYGKQVYTGNDYPTRQAAVLAIAEQPDYNDII